MRSLLRHLAAPSLTFLSVSSIFDGSFSALLQFARNSDCATQLRTPDISHPHIGEPLMAFLAELRVLDGLIIDHSWGTRRKPHRWPRQSMHSQPNHPPTATPSEGGGILPNLTRPRLEGVKSLSPDLEAMVRYRVRAANDLSSTGVVEL